MADMGRRLPSACSGLVTAVSIEQIFGQSAQSVRFWPFSVIE
jgi:hypothetical protein